MRGFTYSAHNKSFNPRAPRGARQSTYCEPATPKGFQSTRPARGATRAVSLLAKPGIVSIHAPRAGRDPFWDSIAAREESFNPRAPRGARRDIARNRCTTSGFNPRAPRGARLGDRIADATSPQFQSTRPARGATVKDPKDSWLMEVSIHAPRAGRDDAWLFRPPPDQGFNPRAPRGARQASL